VGAYDSGDNSWDNACNVTPDKTGNNCTWPGQYANYTYVENIFTSPQSDTLGPYFQIAETYGFSNYTFQTNQGPSFLAHQFLFSGTSAPVYYDNDPTGLWKYLAAENPQLYVNGQPTQTLVSGCFSPGGTKVEDVNASGSESYAYTPPGLNSNTYAGFPCYDHPSIADLLDNPTPPNSPIIWKYYTNPSQQKISIWTAPNALQEICEADPNPLGQGSCTSPTGNTDWAKVEDTPGQILTDISTCSLPAVSWVIPDGTWSDHPGGAGFGDGGPSWVAAIVNAVGGSGQYKCVNTPYWGNTTILITWDDWGGWYDHVAPYTPAGTPILTGGYPGTTGNAAGDGQGYVYGFRVPLLVVSAYTIQTPNVVGYTGYISGNTNLGGLPYPGEFPPYIHDFGSILGYIESVFVPSAITNYGIAGATSGGNNYPFADYFAPDGPFECQKTGGCGSYGTYPLSDFFNLTTPRSFTAITNAKYAPSCFQEPDVTNSNCFPNYPSEPDNDDVDVQD